MKTTSGRYSRVVVATVESSFACDGRDWQEVEIEVWLGIFSLVGGTEHGS